ncbi:MAG: hypothetical protein ACOCWA_09045, partial [Bacteroidota bacterium]
MTQGDATMEMLASSDKALTDFIFRHLQRMYPGVKFFTSREEFHAYVLKNNGRLNDISSTAIGHAFRDAVYIDPQKAVQSTQLHEYAHIYFDALPDTSKVKKGLRELYEANRGPFGSREELDEQIILDIGRMATNQANIEFRGSLLDKFIEYVRQFWAEVKNLLGMASEKDLVRILAKAVWNNKTNIRPNSREGTALVHNMSENMGENGTTGKERPQRTAGNYSIGMTSLIRKYKAEPFDIEYKVDIEKYKLRELYRKKFKSEAPEKLEQDEARRIREQNKKKAESGTSIHRIAEEVFGDLPSVYEDIKEDIPNPILYGVLRDQFRKVKNKILEAFPEAKFKPEYKIVDTKSGVTGVIDVYIDIGNDQVMLLDFKTMSYSPVEEDGLLAEKYKESQQPMKNPISIIPESKQSEHLLQMFGYKKLVEENPEMEDGNKKEVVGMFIIPVVRSLSENDFSIESANIPIYPGIGSVRMINLYLGNKEMLEFTDRPYKNLSKVLQQQKAKEKKYSNVIDKIFESNSQLTNKLDKTLEKLEKALEKEGYLSDVTKKMLEAYHWLSQFMNSDLSKTTHRNVEEVNGTGIRRFYNKLTELGFDRADIVGKNAYSLEKLFWAYSREISKDNIDSFFKEYKVVKNFQRFDYEYPEKPGIYKHKVRYRKEDGAQEREIIISDAGLDNISVNDEVAIIHNFRTSTRSETTDTQYATVTQVNKRGRYVRVINEYGDEILIDNITDKFGLMKIEESAPEGTKLKYYDPPHIYEDVEEKEVHFKDEKMQDEDDAQLTPRSRAEKNRNMRSHRVIWKFFEEHDTTQKLIDFIKNKEAVNEMFEKLTGLEDHIVGGLKTFLAEVSYNHLIADAIRRENRDGPTRLMPITMEFYRSAITEENDVWKDFSTVQAIANNMTFKDIATPKYIPFYIFTHEYIGKMRLMQMEQYDNNKVISELNKKIDNPKNLMTEINGRMYWKTPSSNNLTTNERLFLSYLYSIYRKYHPNFQDQEEGKTKKIPVNEVYATEKEMRQRYGKKYGTTFYELFKGKPYDGIKVELVKPVKTALGIRYEGQGMYMTLGDIKKRFLDDVIKDGNRIDEGLLNSYLGGRITRYRIRHPFFDRSINKRISGSL